MTAPDPAIAPVPSHTPVDPSHDRKGEPARPEPVTLMRDLVMEAWPGPFRAWFAALSDRVDATDPLVVGLLDRLGLAAWRLRRQTEPERPGCDDGVDRDGLRARDQADRQFSRALADLLRYQAACRRIALADRSPGPPERVTRPPRRPGSRRSGPTLARAGAEPPDEPAGPADTRAVLDEPEPATAGVATLEANDPGAQDLELEYPGVGSTRLEALAARAPDDWEQRYRLDPEVSRHWPVVRGTRVLAEVIASALVAGVAPTAILTEHPGLTLDDLAAVARLERQGRTGPWPGADAAPGPTD